MPLNISRLSSLGVTAAELLGIQAAYNTLPISAQAALDVRIEIISNADLTTLISTFRTGQVFAGLLPTGFNPTVSGYKADDQYAIGAGTGAPVAIIGPGAFSYLQATTWGHSYAFGVGAPNTLMGFVNILGRMLRLTTNINSGVGGAVLASDESANPGGVGKILQNWVPQRTAAPYINSILSTSAGFQAHLFVFGINDVGTANKPESWRHALRSSWTALRNARQWESTDAAFTWGPTGLGTDWGTNEIAWTRQNSGTGVRQCLTNNAWVQWAVPADFEGGWVSMRFLEFTGVGVGQINFTVDGVAAGSLGFNDATDVIYPGIVSCSITKRLYIPGAGAHTVRATMPASGASLFCFDSAAIEGSSPSVIFAPTIMKLPNYIGIGYAVPPSDARIDQYNQIMRDVAAEFDSRIVLSDSTEQLLLNPAYLSTSDHLHPSERGHKAMAATLFGPYAKAAASLDLAMNA